MVMQTGVEWYYLWWYTPWEIIKELASAQGQGGSVWDWYGLPYITPYTQSQRMFAKVTESLAV